ncbi:MAG: putative zinc-binding protein [Methanoregula sp.]
MEGQTSSSGCGAEGKKRIIYACSGIGSNVGQLANAAACRLTLEGFGGGSCLAGIGGNVDKLISIGKVADERVVIDGCPLACAKKIMDAQGLATNCYVMITELGISKTPGPHYSESDLQTVVDAVRNASG